MNIIEALTLAKEKPRTKVRPAAWEYRHVEYVRSVNLFFEYEDQPWPSCKSTVMLLREVDELLGEWEVVP